MLELYQCIAPTQTRLKIDGVIKYLCRRKESTSQVAIDEDRGFEFVGGAGKVVAGEVGGENPIADVAQDIFGSDGHYIFGSERSVVVVRGSGGCQAQKKREQEEKHVCWISDGSDGS